MRLVYIPLPEWARKALVEQATKEFRRPQDQGAMIVIERLRNLGYGEDRKE